MEPKDKNYIKEIIDEVKSSEYSEKQATSKATIAPIPNPGKESIKKSQITMTVWVFFGFSALKLI